MCAILSSGFNFVFRQKQLRKRVYFDFNQTWKLFLPCLTIFERESTNYYLRNKFITIYNVCVYAIRITSLVPRPAGNKNYFLEVFCDEFAAANSIGILAYELKQFLDMAMYACVKQQQFGWFKRLFWKPEALNHSMGFVHLKAKLNSAFITLYDI